MAGVAPRGRRPGSVRALQELGRCTSPGFLRATPFIGPAMNQLSGARRPSSALGAWEQERCCSGDGPRVM